MVITMQGYISKYHWGSHLKKERERSRSQPVEKLGLGVVTTKASTDSLGSSEAGVPFQVALDCGKEIERTFMPSNCSQKGVWP